VSVDCLSRVCGIIWIFLFLNQDLSRGQVILNEVCASNASVLVDWEGDSPDWIELLNAGTDTVNLSGYCLSDDRGDLQQWCFPGYRILPGEHLIVFASGKDRSDPPLYWQTVIRLGDEWNYVLPDAGTPAGWRSAGFDDSSWETGPGGIGYGDGDDATVIPSTISLFMRKSFPVEDPSVIQGGALHMDYDDGFVAYLNGNEIARAGVSGYPPTYNTTASGNHEAAMYSGGGPERFDIPAGTGLFLEGENVLAIQVHNVSSGSSDMTAIPFFSVLVTENPADTTPEILQLADSHYHVNFQLDADGDSLYLSDPAGNISDSLVTGFQERDYSLGRSMDDPGKWVVFDVPTPGGPNNSPSYAGYISDSLLFSVPGGRFAFPFQLFLSSSQATDSIYYTLDGSEPTTGSGLFQAPIEVSSDLIVRARIVRSGYVPGKIATQTYFTGADHHLPVVSISTDPFNLWDYNYGIYVKGPNAQPDFPYFDANFWQDWERPAHVEFYDRDGNRGFSLDAGIKIYGGWTRGHPQKSMTIFARSRYGNGNIEYRLFNEKPITEFESFVVRNSGNDWFGRDSESGTMMRDVLMTRMTGNMDLEYQAATQAIIYLNGEYWGIQNIREKISEHFLAANCGADPDRIDLLESDQSVIHGSRDHYAQLISFLNANDIRQQEHYAYVKTRMDVQNFIHYQLSQIYFDNTDWPGNNIKYWRPATPAGKWRWILYDTDFGFGLWRLNNVYNNTLEFAIEPDSPDYANAPWATFLLRTLLQNQEFRHRFINSFADRINTSFKSDSVIHRIRTLKDAIDEEMVLHAEKWSGYYQNWVNRTNELESFASQRPSVMLNHIENTLAPGEKHLLTLEVSDAAAGSIHLNTIHLKKFPWTGIYFHDVPVEVTAVSSLGYRFTGWTGDVSSSSANISFHPVAQMHVTAHFEADPDYAGNPVVINEICYVQDSLSDPGDWVELHNRSDQYVDISGWVLKDSDHLHAYPIRWGTLLEPNGYHVICRNRIAFETVYPEVSRFQGGFDFGFSSMGEVVRLFNSQAEMVDYVNYGITDPWPMVGSGSGYAIELLDPWLDNALPGSWRLSDAPFGTPGEANAHGVQVEEQDTEEARDILFRAGPNPFTRETRIVFYSGTMQPVRLTVYDMNGRFMDLVVERTVEAGYHEFTWTPENADEGFYILRLETPGSVMTRKIVKTR